MRSVIGRRVGTVIIAAGCAMAAACDRGVTDPPPPADVREHVTGAAAQALGADGIFNFSAPTPRAAEPIISPDRARDLAVSYVMSFGPVVGQWWRRDAGRTVDHRRLRPDSRVFFASPAYEPYPKGFHPAFDRAFGPYYLVPMRDGEELPLIVAVSAYSHEVMIDADGLLDLPFYYGMEFSDQALPADRDRRNVTAPLLPEEAVVRVSRLADARISEVPEYVLTDFRSGPLGGLWKLTLERAVRVRTLSGGRTAEVRELYLGRQHGRQLFIAADEQPSEVLTSGLRLPPPGQEMGETPEPVRVAIRPGYPTLFDEVTILAQ